MTEPFKKKNRRTERLVVLLTPAEERLLQSFYSQYKQTHHCSNVSELIRDFIRKGIEEFEEVKS